MSDRTIHIEQYYTALPHIEKRFDKYARQKALRADSYEEYIEWRTSAREELGNILGMSVIGMCVWDLMRLTDYIIMRDEWATDNIACVGFSGGGMQTLYFAALDERVKAAVISGYMYGVKESLLERNGNCSCNYVRGLWEAFDMGDIGAMIAPRPVLIQSARDDHLNGRRGIINAIEQVDIMRKAYTVTHSYDKLIHKIIEGGHHYDSDIDELLRLI